MTIECEEMEGQDFSPTVSDSSQVVEETRVATEEAPTRRLVIREMVLENFKSYAGAQRVGPFHKVRRLVSRLERHVVVVVVVVGSSTRDKT